MKPKHILLAVVLAFVGAFANAAERSQVTLTVFAAASLTDSLEKVTDDFTRATGIRARLAFAASSALARQIEAGARADVFFSADQDWMNYLQERELIDPSTRVELLGNRLALIAPQDSNVSMQLVKETPLLQALGPSGRLAVGDPDSVPAGKYAKAALMSLGLWANVESRLARAENVRVALMYVARGEAPLGVVYSTDAKVEPRVKVVALFPEASHPPITYPVAATVTPQPEARQYLAYLRADAAKRIFAEAGFAIASPAGPERCSGFRFDVTRELAIMQDAPSDVEAGAQRQLDPNKVYSAKLSPQGGVRFAVPPDKSTVDEGSYAGVFRLPALGASTIRVTLNEAAWIDVVQGDRTLASARHTGGHDCPALRKTVEFQVDAKTPLVLQISGSTESKLNVAVTTH